MKIRVDEAADALYFILDDSVIVESEEVQPGVVLDFNDQDQVVGIEIRGIVDRIPPSSLKSVQFEMA